MELYLLIALLFLMVIILGVQLYNFFGSLSSLQEDSNNSKVTLDSLNKALEILQSGSTDITNYLQEFKNPMSSLNRYLSGGSRPHQLRLAKLLRLDLHIDASRQVQAHQRVERLLRWIQNVEQTLVRADLELLTGLLVDEGSLEHRPAARPGGQRNRPCHASARTTSRLHNVCCRGIKELVIIRLELDSNLIACHLAYLYWSIHHISPSRATHPRELCDDLSIVFLNSRISSLSQHPRALAILTRLLQTLCVVWSMNTAHLLLSGCFPCILRACEKSARMRNIPEHLEEIKVFLGFLST